MHKHCKHKLEYCNLCDEVYCTECNKEWRNKYNNYGYYTTCGTLDTTDPGSTGNTILLSHNHN